MEFLRQYLISITAAALISGILTGILGRKGMIGSMGAMLCGLFLSVTILKPVVKLNFNGISEWIEGISFDASQTISDGEQMAANELSMVIIQQTRAYIQDKASSLGADLEVEVSLGSGTIPVPESVVINGTVPPYAKSVLTEIITKDLAIAKENIQWIGKS